MLNRQNVSFIFFVLLIFIILITILGWILYFQNINAKHFEN